MVALHWIDVNLATDCLFPEVCDFESVPGDLFLGVVPCVVGRVVTHPCHKISLKRALISGNKVKHAL